MNLYDIDEETQIDEYGVCHKNFSLRDELEYNFRRAQEQEQQKSLMRQAFENNFYHKSNKQWADSRKNMTPLQPDYMEPASLQFDGKNLAWMENGQPVKYYKAQSGHKNYQSAKNTHIANLGPIPEGDYILEKGTGEDYDNKKERGFLQRTLYGAPWYEDPKSWGSSRVHIQPQEGTETFGRSGMFVHGGATPGSAGCIDLTYHNDDFYKDFKNYNGDIPLKVKYPKDW